MAYVCEPVYSVFGDGFVARSGMDVCDLGVMARFVHNNRESDGVAP